MHYEDSLPDPEPGPGPGPAVPAIAGPEAYVISHRHPDLASNAEVNRRLFQAGFNQAQAQLVYDLAHDCLMPILERLAGAQRDQTRDGHLEQLRQHFGGDARWRQLAPQLAAWGQRNLPAEAYAALAASVEGVKALHRLMQSSEPGLGAGPGAVEDPLGEDDLKRMIQDPRYWKHRDPAFIAKVGAGFDRLYGGA